MEITLVLGLKIKKDKCGDIKTKGLEIFDTIFSTFFT